MLNQNWVALRQQYDDAAASYAAALTLEEIMEATSQAQQRKITLASLEVVREQHPDLHLFNELLVQDLSASPQIQVVPDNLVVRHPGPLVVDGHYGIPLQPARPMWALEYASKSNWRKDYDRNMPLYERLQIPYYLIFSPEASELVLFRLHAGRYRTVLPEATTGLALIPEFQLGVKVLDGWMRYWWNGKLVPLTAELARDNREMRQQMRLKDAALEAKDQLLTQKDQLLSEQERQLVQQKQLLADKDAALAALLQAHARELALLRGNPQS